MGYVWCKYGIGLERCGFGVEEHAKKGKMSLLANNGKFVTKSWMNVESQNTVEEVPILLEHTKVLFKVN